MKGQKMTGTYFRNTGAFRVTLALSAALGLAACDEDGGLAFPGGDGASSTGSAAASAPLQTTTTEEDVERPDIFEVTDRGIWDGRPSLGGAWVAHPDVSEPERALVRNTATGETVVGALFRRERENPGPLLQVSSDMAEELGILPGAPTELYVVVLRREEVTIEAEEAPQNNPVVADLSSPVNVEATPLEPVAAATADGAEIAATSVVAGAAAAIDAAEDAAAPIVDATLPPAVEATDETPDAPVAAVPASAVLPDGPRIQIGVFSVEPNANEAAARLQAAGIPTTVIAQEAGGRTVWSVVSAAGDDADAALAQIKELGYVDAYPLDS